MSNPITKAEAERTRDGYRAGTIALPTDKRAIADRWQRVVDTIEAGESQMATEHSALIRACRETVLLRQAAKALLAKLEDDGKIYEEVQGYDPILSARYRRLRDVVDGKAAP